MQPYVLVTFRGISQQIKHDDGRKINIQVILTTQDFPVAEIN